MQIWSFRAFEAGRVSPGAKTKTVFCGLSAIAASRRFLPGNAWWFPFDLNIFLTQKYQTCSSAELDTLLK